MSTQKGSRKCASCPALIKKGSRCDECRVKRNARLRGEREDKKSKGVCIRCTRPTVPGLVCCESHRTGKTRPEYFAERNNKRKAAGLCIRCPGKAESGSDRCRTCREKSNKAMRRRNRKVREQAIRAYGDKCACCGETEFGFFTIDHVENNGGVHRKEIGVSAGTAFYQWLIRNKFPAGFQVLCMNCNAAKQWWGECPHQTKRKR